MNSTDPIGLSRMVDVFYGHFTLLPTWYGLEIPTPQKVFSRPSFSHPSTRFYNVGDKLFSGMANNTTAMSSRTRDDGNSLN